MLSLEKFRNQHKLLPIKLELFLAIQIIYCKNSQNIVRVVNELSLIANKYANSSSNVEESMKEQEMSVQDIAELASSLAGSHRSYKS